METFDQRFGFLERATFIVGDDNVAWPGNESGYRDPYPLDAGRESWPGVRPADVDEVQALVALANELRVPLWTISRGNNLGYGGPEPRASDTVVLDLGRLDRIIEVNEELCYAIVEPGVTYFDLFHYIQDRGLDLLMSVPALGWGSVLGNALDRGYGMTPLGDHAASQCGMEVVLPTGELLRTGMWAMEGSVLGPIFKGGFGPNLDPLFTQSNLGVVTKIGIWLTRWPEVYVAGTVTVENEEDLPQLIDTISELRRKEVIQNNALCGNVVRAATMNGNRRKWYDGEGAIPDDRLEEIREELGVGNWNARFGLYCDKPIAEARLRVIRQAFEGLDGFKVEWAFYEGAEGKKLTYDDIAPIHSNQLIGIPSLGALSTVDWAADTGGHIDIAPILPARGADVYAFYRETKELYRSYGFDLYIGYHLYPRHMVHVAMIFFDTTDDEQLARAKDLYRAVLSAAQAHGYSPYRAHIDFMDLIADGFDYNGHALRRLQETIKDALDPVGILAPGKQGVWPRDHRTVGSLAPSQPRAVELRDMH